MVTHGGSMLTLPQLAQLIAGLQSRGYQVVGPAARDGAIIYDVVEKLEDLPVGWTDEQDAGHYQLRRRNDEALFGYAVGPQSWKKYLHPAEVRLMTAERNGPSFRILNNETLPPRRAFLGVRACELAAIAVQDRVLMGDHYVDSIYAARREGIFIVAVHCTHAASTCFCTSMNTGPRAQGAYDLAITELVSPGRHEFVVEAASDAGREILAELAPSAASDAVYKEAEAAVEHTASQIQRRMDTTAHSGIALHQLRSSSMGQRRGSLPHLCQLHHGLPDLLLHDSGGC